MTYNTYRETLEVSKCIIYMYFNFLLTNFLCGNPRHKIQGKRRVHSTVKEKQYKALSDYDASYIHLAPHIGL